MSDSHWSINFLLHSYWLCFIFLFSDLVFELSVFLIGYNNNFPIYQIRILTTRKMSNNKLLGVNKLFCINTSFSFILGLSDEDHENVELFTSTLLDPVLIGTIIDPLLTIKY